MQNTLYTNDNLFVLYGMNSEIADLIYLDPPFNSKRMYSAPVGTKAAGASFKDMWTWDDINEAYLDKLVDKYPHLVSFIQSIGTMHSKAMMAYVTYMTQRLIEMHRVLKPTGSIYLHCDPTASHYLKNVMDGIFGSNNFRNEIIWKRTNNPKGSQFKAKKYGQYNDVIFFYAKSKDAYFELDNAKKQLTDKELLKKYSLIDEHGRYYKGPIECSPTMGDRPNLCYEYKGYRNKYASGWRMTKERLIELDERGDLGWGENGSPFRKLRPHDDRGHPISNLWDDLPRIQSKAKEATGYPTQKPLALMHRIITASSKVGDLVLDPFCGCATTCVAAEQLQRKWIGIDVEEKAVSELIDRLSDDGQDLFTNFIHLTKPPQRTDLQIESPHAKHVKDRLFAEQSGNCNGCGESFQIWNLEIDHIVPKVKGGGDYVENYQLLCGSCNRIKGDRPMEYLRTKLEVRLKAIRSKITYGL
jgi:site-specific DNA-methyltransferase (adenine-specific)